MITLYYDTTSGMFQRGFADSRKINQIIVARGDTPTVTLYPLANNAVIELTGTLEEMIFVAKMDFANGTDPLILADEWTLNNETGAYTATLAADGEALDTLIGSDEFLDLKAQFSFRTSELGNNTSRTIAFRCGNDLWKGTEGTPLALATPDEWLTARAVRYDAAQSLSDEQKTQARANIGAGTGGGEINSTTATAFTGVIAGNGSNVVEIATSEGGNGEADDGKVVKFSSKLRIGQNSYMRFAGSEIAGECFINIGDGGFIDTENGGSIITANGGNIDTTAGGSFATGTGNLQGPDQDGTIALTSDVQSAKDYADTLVIGLVDDRGNFDASVNTFPTTGGSGTAGAILKGDLWTLSVIASSGPLNGYPVGTVIRALVDTPGNTTSNWSILEHGFGYTAENAANKSTNIASDTGSSTKYPSVAAVETFASPKSGSTSITTLGTIGTGTWQGTAIADSYISSAATWNAKQSAITFGTGVQTALGVNIGSAGAPVLNGGALGTPSSGNASNLTNFPTLNQNTTGSAASLSVSGQTGIITFTGTTSTNRVKTVRDAADTILELGGSYTPSGTWTNLTLVTPVLGTPQSGTLTNCTGLPVSTGVSGLGTSVASTLAQAINTASGFVTQLGGDGRYGYSVNSTTERTRTTQNVWSDDEDLTAALAANSYYLYEVVIFSDGSQTGVLAARMKYTGTINASGANNIGMHMITSAVVIKRAWTSITAGSVTESAGCDYATKICGILPTGTSGTLSLQITNSSSSGTAKRTVGILKIQKL